MEEKESFNVTADATDGRYRKNIQLWIDVAIVTKRNQKTGIYTYGKVRWILTSKAFHSRGIKVMLDDRQVGRVQKIINTNQEDAGN
jgi:uncharacterized repeat protein (TIGR03833 family)